MPRVPLILWRFLVADLLKVVLLTAGVLVVFIAFTATFRPFIDGRLSPGQTLRFMGLALLPMMQFAMPFAAGFGATLAYHRFAAENEAQAALVSGVSHRTLLAPAAITGLALALLLGALNLEIIPRFLRSMQLLLGADLARLIVANIESGRSVRLPDGVIVHADAIQRRPAEPGSRATDHFVMEGVLAVKTGKGFGVERWVAAQRAGVWFFDAAAAPPSGLVVIRLVDAESSGEFEGGAGKIDLRFVPPSPFNDSTKFYSTRDLLRLRREPERLPSVEHRRRMLADALEADRIESEVRDLLRATGRVTLVNPEGESATIRAGDLRRSGERWALTPPAPGKTVEITWRLAGERARTQSAERAFLTPWTADEPALAMFGVATTAAAAADRPATLTLELENVTTHDAAGVGGATLPRRVYGGLIPVGERRSVLRATSAELLSESAGAAEGSSVRGAAERLRSTLDWLGREVLSRHHERAAMAASCLVMMLAGAVGGMRLRDSRPLLVYAWSFGPSLLAILGIYSGQSVLVDSPLIGVLVVWGGIVGLALFVAFDYRAMARH